MLKHTGVQLLLLRILKMKIPPFYELMRLKLIRQNEIINVVNISQISSNA